MRKRLIAVAASSLLVLTACSTKKETTTTQTASVKIASPADGAKIKGNTVPLQLTPTGVEIVKADGSTSPKSAHYHVFIDRSPTPQGEAIPREPGIVHSAASPTLLTGLSVGEHTLTVVLGDGSHRRFGEGSSTIKVTLEGPSIDASAPATSKAGEPVVITVKVTGVTLVKADGAAAGKTGHLHVLVDQDQPVAGQPIPKDAGIIHTTDTTITVPALKAGEHTIWVVLGDGGHVPYDPPVLDKLVITTT